MVAETERYEYDYGTKKSKERTSVANGVKVLRSFRLKNAKYINRLKCTIRATGALSMNTQYANTVQM